MTEFNQENDRQDPADQYRTDEAVQTEPQPGADDSFDDGDAPEADDEPVPAAPAPVEVSAQDQAETTRTRIHGDEYTVDPNKGYRVVAGAPAQQESSDSDEDSSDES